MPFPRALGILFHHRAIISFTLYIYDLCNMFLHVSVLRLHTIWFNYLSRLLIVHYHISNSKLKVIISSHASTVFLFINLSLYLHLNLLSNYVASTCQLMCFLWRNIFPFIRQFVMTYYKTSIVKPFQTHSVSLYNAVYIVLCQQVTWWYK